MLKQTGSGRFQYVYYVGYLKSLDLSNFDTSNVTTMDSMLRACTSLTTLDLSNFNTSNVTNMDAMFTCVISSYEYYYYYNNSTATRSLLIIIFVSDLWDISKVTGESQLITRMFNGCESLVGATSYNSSKTNRTYANYTTGYLTHKSNS